MSAGNEQFEEIKKLFEQKGKELRESVTEDVKELQGKKEAEYLKSLEALESKHSETIQEVEKLALQLDAKKKALEGGKSFDDYLNDGVKAFHEKNGSLAKFIREGGTKAFNIEVKAPADTTRSILRGTDDIPQAMREAGVAKFPKRRILMQDIVMMGTTTSDVVDWVERATLEGSAGQTAEGTTFNQISATYKKNSAAVEKTTAYWKTTVESLEDIDFLRSEINTELLEEIRLALDSQLFGGNGASPNHQGVNTIAVAWAKQGTDVVANANKIDVLHHAITQIMAPTDATLRNPRAHGYAPNYILLNPIDVLTIRLLKDTQANYLLPNYLTNSGLEVAGVPIIETNLVTAGNFLVGDFNKAKFFVKRGLNLQTADQNQDDFEKDFITVKGSIRGAFRVKEVDYSAFVKGDFASAIAALGV